jgi:CheY-like chemotaxis protein
MTEKETGLEVELIFEIRDTGIGIPLDKVDRLFTPFTQIDEGMNRKYGGTGLGLAISKDIVELMGGKIGVKSNENAGSTFWFTVKFQKQVKESSKSPEKNIIITQSDDNLPGRILVVEDNITNQFVAKSILKKLGYKADIVSSGYECIDALKQKEYCAIFMDCQMPDIDGFQTTSKIRKGENGIKDPDIVIIAFTAHAMEGYKDLCLKAGMNDYISKPIKISEMKRVLNQWINTNNNITDEIYIIQPG